MYRVSPFNYLIGGILSTALANTNVVCASNEYLHFNPTSGTCADYMAPYMNTSGGYLANPNATRSCAIAESQSTATAACKSTLNGSRFPLKRLLQLFESGGNGWKLIHTSPLS